MQNCLNSNIERRVPEIERISTNTSYSSIKLTYQMFYNFLILQEEAQKLFSNSVPLIISIRKDWCHKLQYTCLLLSPRSWRTSGPSSIPRLNQYESKASGLVILQIRFNFCIKCKQNRKNIEVGKDGT